MKNKFLKLSIFTLLFIILIIPQYTYSFSTKNSNSNNLENGENERVVYLTFDDGPSKNTPLILDILKENNVHGTFFIISPYVESHIPIVKRAFDEGNVIGNHTADHEYNRVYTSEDVFFKNFNKQQIFIKEVTGKDCTIFRFPGGSNNVNVRNAHGKNFTKNITEKLNSQGIQVYDWNVDSGDAKGNNIPASTLVKNVERELKDKDGNYKECAIILMHDCMTKNTTVKALPEIINLLKELDYRFDILE